MCSILDGVFGLQVISLGVSNLGYVISYLCDLGQVFTAKVVYFEVLWFLSCETYMKVF